MAKSASQTQKANVAEVPVVRVIAVGEAPSVPTYYANNTAIETSLWDVCLRFAETIETDRAQNITKVRELAYVRLSPQHARVIVDILTNQLETYEKSFGKIPRILSPPKPT